jgi:hypothetical protein
MTIARKNQSDPLCPGLCTRAGLDLYDEAKHYSTLSDAALIFGGVTAAAGVGLSVWLWLHSGTADPQGNARLKVRLSGAASSTGGTLTLEGRW